MLVLIKSNFCVSARLHRNGEVHTPGREAADAKAAEKGDLLCTANPVNPSSFRISSAAKQRAKWLGGRDEPEASSGQRQRK